MWITETIDTTESYQDKNGTKRNETNNSEVLINLLTGSSSLLFRIPANKNPIRPV
jgi:hypothetical protein